MITGFNPTDMYAADHVRRVLTTFPGVFSGIGEFTIHKEFVSSKIAGETASLTEPRARSPARFRRRGRARRADLTTTSTRRFPSRGRTPYQVMQLRDLFLRHPKTTIIWAHIGLGRVVRPVKDQARRSSIARSPIRRWTTSTSISPGTKRRSTSSRRRRPSRRRPI